MGKNILVIGSGLTGSVLAYKHKNSGDNVTVFEKRSHIGGNVYTEFSNGICVHRYGAHIFHTSEKEVWDFVNQFVHFNDYRHQVKSRYNNRLYSLPINMNTMNEFFGITDPNEITNDKLEKIYSALFYGYSSKQWNKPIEQLDKEVFKRLPVRNTFNNDYFDDTYQGIPTEGYTKLIECLLKGCNVITNFKIYNTFDFSGYDLIYNTGPIDEFFDCCLGKLEYRSLSFVNEYHTDLTFQDYAVINEADINVPYTRIIEHKHFNNNNQKDTIITYEYPTDYDGNNEPYYVINNNKNNKLYEDYVKLAKMKFPNMIFCGRLGSYKYYDMDDAIIEACDIYNHETLYRQNNSRIS